MRFRGMFQGVSLVLFLALLVLASGALAEHARLDLFLRMDPLVLLGGLRGGQASFMLLLPGLVVILLTLVLGRFFCSTLCPLGTTIDITDRLLARVRKRLKLQGRVPKRAGAWKYLVLSFAAGAVLAGSSLFLLVSPLSLATRFYGLVLYPGFASGANLGAQLVRETGGLLGIEAFEYLSLPVPGYSLAWATLALVIPILAMGLVVPRFWCRYLCPSGALFALLSLRRVLHRDVSDACTGCSACRKACPMGAVGQDPRAAGTSGCIVCEQCAHVCPEDAVSFRFKKPSAPFPRSRSGLSYSSPANINGSPPPAAGEGQGEGATVGSSPRPPLPDPLPPGERGPVFQERGSGKRSGHASGPTGFSRHRRTLLFSGLFGAGGSAVALALPGPLHSKAAAAPIVRPPGALPEAHFLAGCARCGECMRACPTNTLQPASLSAWVAGFFSPVVTPRTGPCEPSCTKCGRVCPTGAIRELPAEEKVWAKIGTAKIDRRRCIAWEKSKECLVCDEVCPFGAIDLKRTEGVRVPVPFMDGKRCNGCGFCEYHCPVDGTSAIVVEPEGALRMARGSYIRSGREAGLRFEVKGPSPVTEEAAPPVGGLPPGFEE